MRVTIDRTGAYTVHILGGVTGPFIDLDLSPGVAYSLLQALEAKRAELRDLALNYYTCPDCANTHPNAQTCPDIRREE
jgi:hypothetical protein